jgi:hypothetical protein
MAEVQRMTVDEVVSYFLELLGDRCHVLTLAQQARPPDGLGRLLSCSQPVWAHQLVPGERQPVIGRIRSPETKRSLGSVHCSTPSVAAL